MSLSPENTAAELNPQSKIDSVASTPPVDDKQQQQQQLSTETKAETPEDPNWKAFREARKKDRADKEAAERKAADKEAEVLALKSAMEAAFARDQQSKPTYQQDPYGYMTNGPTDETEEQRIEKAVTAAIAKREQIAEQQRQQREQVEYPQRLAQTYPDFNNTITTENLDYLEYHYPEVAGPLRRLPDNYEKWKDVYNSIKKFVPNATNSKRDAARADANMSKPKSISSTGLTQESQTSSARLSDDRKAANWERMQRLIKGLT